MTAMSVIIEAGEVGDAGEGAQLERTLMGGLELRVFVWWAGVRIADRCAIVGVNPLAVGLALGVVTGGGDVDGGGVVE